MASSGRTSSRELAVRIRQVVLRDYVSGMPSESELYINFTLKLKMPQHRKCVIFG